jgi:aspartyl-tRNA synthetase
VDQAPFLRIPYAEAMDKYGSDKPDLRIPVVLQDVSQIFQASKFEMFKKQVDKGACVKAIPVRGIAARGKPFCESMLEFAVSKPVGAKGLAYIIWKDGEASGKPITNHLNAQEIDSIRLHCGLEDGDVVFFVCDKKEKADKIAGLVRSEIGERLRLDIQTFALSAMESSEGDDDGKSGDESFIDRAAKEDPSLSSLKKREAAFKAIVLTQVGDKGTAFLDDMLAAAKTEGAPLAFYIAAQDGKTVQSHFADVLPEKDRRIIDDRIKLKDGDAALFVFGRGKDIAATARLLRRKLSERLHLPQVDDFRFCWIVDFPMFEKDEKTGKIQFSHNPFSMPQGGMDALIAKDPLDILAYQYDIVCNGEELSSGAIRNHRLDVMYKAFEIAGYPKEEVDEKFQNMVKAFRLGAPPHGGIAPGLDRIVMLLTGKSSIRDTIAFPMNQAAQDLMMDAPRAVSDAQLQELSIRIEIP